MNTIQVFWGYKCFHVIEPFDEASLKNAAKSLPGYSTWFVEWLMDMDAFAGIPEEN